MRFFVLGISFALLLPACKTKNDVKHERELEKIKQEVNQVRGDKADFEVLSEELRIEISQINALLSERSALQDRQHEQLKEEISALQMRIQALEQKAVNEEMESVKAQTPPPAEKKKKENPFEAGKKAFDDGDFDAAIDHLKSVANGSGGDAKKAQFLLAESYYNAKDYAAAALEFGEYKKRWPSDEKVPTAIYRQANAFRSLGKSKEAKLFYQELIDKHPKNSLVAKAKNEMKALK